ncbi:hypothetical protein TRFO_01058 [Tritrichomonas foetus]|uniref:Nucleolar GTP-binding protein 2 n=1 Tax=Tritrichomonas foetus TaxID=1144522 RepID=A0A1J4KN80_9EUKA|nr:hypothetical protein TRFO_01058 [Tritrichomonas foetus]|eukprot:OHT11158.1 hypothetical protein TRFO_01058 [Tritrichomonas foetus]
MGRHRTSRAKDKLIRDPKRKLSNKRNRDLKLKGRREAYQKSITNKARASKAFFEAAYPSLNPKPSDLERVSKPISEKFIERVKLAQSTYDSLIENADQTQALIEILDARDPLSFRFLDIEGETESQKKPLIFIINKIDLVPASAVAQWIKSLSQTAPTIAVSLANPESCAELINKTISEVAPEAAKIAVVGAPNVGKTTLCQLIGDKLVDTEPWKWTICSNSLGLTNSVPWKGRIREFCVDTFERVTTDLIFTLMDVKKDESVGNTLVAFGKKHGISKQEAPEKIMDKFLNGEWKWFAKAPETNQELEVSELQQKSLSVCDKTDESAFIVLGEGKTVQMDKKALEFELPEPDSSEYEDDEEEEEKGEEN